MDAETLGHESNQNATTGLVGFFAKKSEKMEGKMLGMDENMVNQFKFRDGIATVDPRILKISIPSLSWDWQDALHWPAL